MAAGGYGYAHSAVLSENFPARHAGGPRVRELVLLAFERDVTAPEVMAEAARRRLSAPTYEDALYFGIQYPEAQRAAPILFLHEPWVGYFGRRDVLCLWDNAGRRELGLEGFDDSWHRGVRFAFVERESLVTELLIRHARAGEGSAIHDVTLAAYEEYAPRMPAPLWRAYRQNIVETLAHPEPALQLVAEDGGAVVGAVLLYPAAPGADMPRPWPEVRLLAVAPVARGRGIGAALMHECIRRTRASGATVLSLHTTDLMGVAMAMYKGMGFVRAPEIDLTPAPGVVIKGYRLDLA